jgi:hypothetical protein
VIAEDVYNQALDLVGRPRIGSFYDGTPEAAIGLDIFGQTRDALLEAMRPDWSVQDVRLTLLSSAPEYSYVYVPWSTEYPDMPWLYEYATPADCLVPLAIKPAFDTIPVWRPRPVSFRAKANKAYRAYTILTNQKDAILTCVSRVLDPDLWDNSFVEAAVEMLAKKLGTQKEQPNADNARGRGERGAG